MNNDLQVETFARQHVYNPRIDLVSVPADFGQGANDGAYYPVGLLTIASRLRRTMPLANIRVVDLHHEPVYRPRADVVGISASSTLNYRNVLSIARQAKAAGATVVLGGPHTTHLADQILRNRIGLIDFVIRGKGEIAFEQLIKALHDKWGLEAVPALSWRNDSGEPVHNVLIPTRWTYDSLLPLDLSTLSSGVEDYWDAFRRRIDRRVDAAFIVFTHFGCGYREMMLSRHNDCRQLARWCSYCSLNDPLSIRTGKRIVEDALWLLKSTNVRPGANVLLKCYGDNIGTQRAVLRDLATAIEESAEWQLYRIGWTFYTQSSRVSPDLIELLRRVGTRNLFIGFDSADDEVQQLNGLGTSITAHRRAVRLCKNAGIRIQAGFVLGCAGETRRSVENTVRFAGELAQTGVLERINSAILFIIPGSPAYSRLCEREPWIRILDDLPTDEIQSYWFRHFCPDLGANAAECFRILRWAANQLDELSPGPHASMGFISERLSPISALAEAARI